MHGASHLRWLMTVPGGRRMSRPILLFVAFAALTATILAGPLWHVRQHALSSGAKLVSSFAQLMDEQSTRTIQNIDQTLVFIAAQLDKVSGSGPDRTSAMSAELAKFIKDRPFLTAIWILDDRGRTVFASDDANLGLDRSDHPYFHHHRDNARSGFYFGIPRRSTETGQWYIPATVPMRRSDGTLAGVVVGAVDPRYFDRAWTIDDENASYALGLLRTDGYLLMRSPFEAKVLGLALRDTPALASIRRGIGTGSYQVVSVVDGQHRLISFRQLNAYPSLFVLVGVSVDHLLGDWYRNVIGVGVGWLIAMSALGTVGYRLMRESASRLSAEKRYRLLFDANPYSAFVVDQTTSRIMAVNDAAVRRYGWSRQEFLQMSPADVRLEDNAAARKIAMESPGLITSGHKHRRKDGSIIDVELAMQPIEFGGRPAVLVLANDVTERTRIESARQSAEAQLRQAQKMEAVGQLTGGIAHDFNNILTVILANSDALLKEEAGPEISHRLTEISTAVQRAADLTRQLLAFSRKQPLKPQSTDINGLVITTSKLLLRALGEQIELSSSLSANLWRVNVDRAQLETALVNLCINARDAMPSGGKLVLETRNVTLDSDYCASHPDAEPGDYAMLAVTDTGTGIPAADLPRIFEPFFTTKEVGKGTGLGLSMVYGFIKQSRGHVGVYSEPGRGTAFRLYLPRHDAHEQAEECKEHVIAGGTERILVVEDDPQVRNNVVRMVKGLGYQVTEASSGAEALAACEVASVPFELLLTEVVMPGGMSGKVVADVVTRLSPHTKVVFMSGYTQDAITRQGELGPDVLLLNKPFRQADLARMLREALRC
jgi:PAS domain S-box-containing protein